MALVGANLVPLVGVVFLGWDVAAIVVLYWAENLIVGFYSVLRMAAAPPAFESFAGHLFEVFLIIVFCFYFGFYCMLQGALLRILLVVRGPWQLPDLSRLDPDAWLLLPRVPAGVIWAVAGLFISHGISFVENYLLRGEYRTSDVAMLQRRPMARVTILFLAIYLSGAFVLALGSPVPLLAAFVVLKGGFDLLCHRRSHRPTGQASSGEWERWALVKTNRAEVKQGDQVIGYLKKGDRVKIYYVDQKGGWARIWVKVGGQAKPGYVRLTDLEPPERKSIEVPGD